MKKFTEWVGAIREAEERQMSELQKSYKDYFGAKLNKFNAKSPADLTEEQKKEFFNEIKKDWEIGTGAKPAGKKDVEEHGVKESVNEANQEEQIKKECISKLSDFFGCAPGNLSKFKFDGNDDIKELTKALRSTSDEGTAQYYRVAILVAKRDLGINESEDLNESAIEIASGIILGLVGLKTIGLLAKGIFGTLKLKMMKDPEKLKELADLIYDRAITKDSKGLLQGALWVNAVKRMIDKGEIKDGFQLCKTSLAMDKIDINKIFEAEGFDLSEDVNEEVINEAVATPEELASFIQKEEKHFATFLKPKKLTASVSGKVVTIKPGSGSFTITVDYAKSTIDTTGKPEWPESTSYVELMEYIKITKFKLNESIVNESRFNNYGWYLRLPKNVINNELKSVTNNLQNYYDTASKGNDLQQDVLEEIIDELEKVKKQLKAFTKGQKPTGVYESAEFEINEGEINYKTDKYALVLVGGSIGSKGSFPLFVSGQMGSIVETSNDKEALVEGKKRRNKQLSPGEKKYYRMSYKVIELTSNKIKEIDLLISKQSSSEDTIIDESDESVANEKLDTKYWADYNKDTSGQGEKSWEEKSKEFEDTFEEAVVLWNREAEGPENRIKGAQIQNIKKLAEEFFKIEKWISVNVIQAMIMQES